MRYQHENTGTCSTMVTFDLTDGIVSDVRFTGGCDGNLKAIGKLVEGQDARRVAGLLRGNSCDGGSTSCGDQLARALEEALNQQGR